MCVCVCVHANDRWNARFLVFAAVKFQVELFWVVTPFSFVVGYQRFGSPCCLYLQGEVTTTTLHHVTTQKASTWTYDILIFKIFIGTEYFV